MKWLIALGVLALGFVVASILSSVIRKALSKPNRPEQIRTISAPAGSLGFSIVLAGALIASLGIASPDALKTFPKGIVNFIPRALVCVLLLIMGNGVATIVSSAIGGSLLKATGKPQNQITRLVKGLLVGAFAILAISQLGVNTRIIDMITAGLIFSASLSIALLTGLGGKGLAGDLASGRYLRRVLRVGDSLHCESIAGGAVHAIHAIHGASVMLRSETDAHETTFVHIPNTILLNSVLTVTRKD